MEKKATTNVQLFLAIGTLISFFAVIFQLYLIIVNRKASVIETIIRYFSFFTILTNILVAVFFLFLWLMPKSRLGIFFSKPKTITAITVYIFVVGLIYNVILRFLWAPTGLQLVVNELLHTIIPLYFIVFWIVFVPKNQLQWNDFWPWLLYPLVYLIYTLWHGTLANFYPYPFIDANALGYPKVLVNSVVLSFVFLFISIAFIGIAKIMTRNAR